MYPEWYHMHHCRHRNATYVDRVFKTPVGHLLVIFIRPEDHSWLHASADRREWEKREWAEMVTKHQARYGTRGLTDEEYNACLKYR
jgi:hypothetical protein